MQGKFLNGSQWSPFLGIFALVLSPALESVLRSMTCFKWTAYSRSGGMSHLRLGYKCFVIYILLVNLLCQTPNSGVQTAILWVVQWRKQHGKELMSSTISLKGCESLESRVKSHKQVSDPGSGSSSIKLWYDHSPKTIPWYQVYEGPWVRGVS